MQLNVNDAPAIEVCERTFGGEFNETLVHQAVVAYMAGGRQGSKQQKTRSDVRGGGKKPWKQKGTGRARFGSTRNPIWRHGGIVFGPRGNENYTLKVSKTAKRVALRQALSMAHTAKKVVVQDITTTGKTAEIAKFLADNKFTRRTLVVVDEKSPEMLRATRNIQDVKLVRATYLNVYDILNADAIILSKAAVKAVEAWLGTDQTPAKETK